MLILLKINRQQIHWLEKPKVPSHIYIFSFGLKNSEWITCKTVNLYWACFTHMYAVQKVVHANDWFFALMPFQ